VGINAILAKIREIAEVSSFYRNKRTPNYRELARMGHARIYVILYMHLLSLIRFLHFR